ncbi:hypothetical protein GGR92_004994 [Spirosoma lacussanchae]|uniref:nucleotidyl transferase AbiEii/AbiGii toxin family protein n=1 Tax=Spirosoma lacussanchae TaxID=1884249 RepID=UPI0011086839|nr:nucleotidyl transferase AbiEii/AbiGii toxin family protein [Spirosoma lacussanchae]
MILPETFTRDWLVAVGKRFPKPVNLKLLEKVVWALRLLEQLQIYDLSFVFKGGTSLVLHYEQPRRFSIDVDIIMPQRPVNLTECFDAIVEAGAFVRWEDDSLRASHAGVPVGHFKFFYTSAVDPQHPLEPILLDILFAEVKYPHVIQKAIRHPWIRTEEPLVSVRLPDTDSLLGDKLTAFAPNTTGILYTKQRPAEIIKQLFDVAQLFDAVADLSVVGQAFLHMAQEEIAYRRLPITPADVLTDVVNTALLITRRDDKDPYFTQLQEGIRRLASFAIGPFTIEGAILASAKAAYLSRLLTESATTFRRYAQPAEIADWQLNDPTVNRLNKLKKSQPEAFFYWYLAIH